MSSFIEVLNSSPNKDNEKLRAREVGRGSETKTGLLQKEGGMKGKVRPRKVCLCYLLKRVLKCCKDNYLRKTRSHQCNKSKELEFT